MQKMNKFLQDGESILKLVKCEKYDPTIFYFSSSPKPTRFQRAASPLTTGSQRKATFIVGSPSSGSPSSSPVSRGSYNRSPTLNSPSPKHEKVVPQKMSPSNQTSSGKNSPTAPVPIVGSSPRNDPRSCDDEYSKSAPIMVPHPRRSSFSSSLKTSPASPSSPVSESPKPSRVQTSPNIPYIRTGNTSGGSDISTSPSPSQKQPPVLSQTQFPQRSSGLSQSPKQSRGLIHVQSSKRSPGSTPTQSPNISPLVAAFSPYSPGKARDGTEVSFASLLNHTGKKKIVKARSSPSLSTTGAWALEAKSKRISQLDLKPLGSPPKTSGMTNLGCIKYRSPNAGTLARVKENPTKPSLFTNVLGTPPSPGFEGDRMKPIKGIFFGKLSDYRLEYGNSTH